MTTTTTSGAAYAALPMSTAMHAIDGVTACWPSDQMRAFADATCALRAHHGQAPAAPPECKTEAERTAFAFGWFKALERQRWQAPAQTAPESFLEIPDVQDESGINSHYSRELVLECINAALASHGQAPASKIEGLTAAQESLGVEFEKVLHNNLFDLYEESTPQRQAPAQAAPAAVVGMRVTDAMALAFHSALSDGAIGADEVEDIKTGLRAALAAAPTTQPAPQQEPSYISVQLAEMVLSDCGHSSNYTPLLNRVAARIDAHVERCLESKKTTQQEPFAWHVCSVNSDGSLSLEHAAAWKEAAHEHINDAITEHDIEGAGSWVVRPAYHAPQPSPAAQGDALDAAKQCLEMGESFRALRRVVNLLLEARRNLGPEDHELRDRIDQLLRADTARAAQEGK